MNILAHEISRRDQISGKARAATCRGQVGRAVGLLDRQPNTHTEILLIDLASYSEYVDEIERELSRIPRGSLGANCLKVVLALGEAESLDQDALKEWSDCIVRHTYCDTTVDFCAVDNPDESICPPDIPENLDDTFALEESIIALTGQLMRGDWNRAKTQVKRARNLLTAVGAPERFNTALPRSDGAVAKSVYGRADTLLCTGTRVPSDAVEACQSLRDLLIQGVTSDEEADLNDAVSSLLQAYGLDSDR